MDSWVVWTIAACVLGVGEMLTMGFFLAPFAAGALLAALLSAAGASGAVAVIGFLGVAVASLALLRPLAMRHRSMPPQIRTGAAALIGRRALVLERIANREGVGSVKIGGEVWTARAFDDDRVIEAGEQVEVVEIRGATALVME
jgi:membrane protein implicated in regulation of membrane protease activity